MVNDMVCGRRLSSLQIMSHVGTTLGIGSRINQSRVSQEQFVLSDSFRSACTTACRTTQLKE